jgi:type IV pilus assembly protein PilX
MSPSPRFTSRGPTEAQRGSSLIVVLIMLSMILVIGLISTRLALFSERSARNDRDRQIAFQSAEAALLDAELDIMGPNTTTGNRVCLFDSKAPGEFINGCGTQSKAGMCLNTTSSGDAWRAVKTLYSSETGTIATNQTVQYGQFTGQSLPNGNSGLSARLPRYTIEAVRYAGTGAANDNVGSSIKPEYAFLVTAMGFGTRTETQVLLQTLIYKPANKPGAGC